MTSCANWLVKGLSMTESIPENPLPTPANTARPTLQEEQFNFPMDAKWEIHDSEKSDDQPPILPREWIALLLIVALCDVTIYHGQGFAGYAVLFAVAPALLTLGVVRRHWNRSLWILAVLAALASIRLVWCGSDAAVVAGFAILCGMAMGLAGLQPHVIQGAVFVAHLISAGHRGLHHYSRSLARFNPGIFKKDWLAVVLPILTVVVFGAIFVLANPDLVKSFSSGLTAIVETLQRWLGHFQGLEFLFCAGVAWLTIGALRPDVKQVSAADEAVHASAQTAEAPLYKAFRNTLVMVIGLFGVYLAFEFLTLWFRRFPKGFHYSGYAHEGAAWLTVALGLATLLLSIIFRGQILNDPRLAGLRRLTWIWSVENLLLAIAVFNRLSIYVGFNGMTRMRVIGYLGAASVVGGFLLVLRKISRNHNFVWLIRRQLWTVALAGYLYAILPVDAFVNHYNVRRILSGDPAPCVQISVHATSAEGFLQLKPLLNCDDEIIRNGIRAMLADRLFLSELGANSRVPSGWTSYQIAEVRLREQLRAVNADLNFLDDASQHGEVLATFYKYAYQWY
jgi:hypothetical protein